MPSTSKKQHNFMAAIAHNPAFAKKVGVPQSVGKDFNNADKGKKFKEGGAMKHEDIKLDKKIVKKAVGMHDKQQHGGKKTNLSTLKKGGMACAPKKMAKGGLAAGHKSADGIATKGKTKGREVKMMSGGKC
jgi:hypothetical protein